MSIPRVPTAEAIATAPDRRIPPERPPLLRPPPVRPDARTVSGYRTIAPTTTAAPAGRLLSYGEGPAATYSPGRFPAKYHRR